MKKVTFNPLVLLLTATLIAAIPASVTAGVTTWTGGGANQDWSTSGNWSPGTGASAPPAATDSVLFRATGSASPAGTVNNIVDASFGGAIVALLFTNEVANTFHTTQIPSGATLTINGPITVGTNNQTATYTVTGGGTLRGGTGTSAFLVAGNNGGTLTLDMSTLTNFIFNSGGAGGTFSLSSDVFSGISSAGNVKLAAVSNNVTATTLTVGLNNTSGNSTLTLGAGTNIINANTIQIAWDKTSGNFVFGGATGGLRLRNAAGTGRANVSLGDHSHSGSASASVTGTIALKGHYVDLMINSLVLGNRHARSGGTSTGVFSFDAGIVDVNGINMNTNLSGGSASPGTFSAGGGVLKVNGNVSLAACAGTAGTGTLILTNGTSVTVGGSIIKTTSAGTGNVSITNSTVTFASAAGTIGVPGQSIDNLNISNAVFHFKLDNNSPVTSISAATVNATGSNVLVIDTIFNMGSAATATFTLVSYSGADPFPTFTGAAGTVTNLILPNGFTGQLLDNGGQIDLQITAPATRSVVWYGATNAVLVSNWQTNALTTNWVDQADSSPQPFANLDPVTFDDTAVNPTVTLLTTNVPNGITVNNSVINYVFNGPGKISGGTSLTKNNNATLSMSEFGGDDFSGGITVNGGTLVLDQTNSAISGGLTINSGAVAQIGNNDGGGALPAGTLVDEGTLAFNRADNLSLGINISGGGGLTKAGNGTLTLTASNGYTGLTIISKGTLALSGAGIISNSVGVLLSNATLNVSAKTTTTLLTDLSITNASITVGATNLQQVPLVVNTFEIDGSTQSNLLNFTTLPGVAIYPATIPVIKSANAISLGAGGNFNFAVGSLPGGSLGYLTESADSTTVLLTLTSGPVGPRSSVTWAGVNNTTATTNWSDAVNWQLPGAPAATDSVFFGDGASTVGDASTINNVVDTSTTVASLTYNQAGGQYHVTQIPLNTALVVNNNLSVGNATLDGAVAHVAFADAGTLVVNGSSNGNLVGNSGANNSTGDASLDLSRLSNFVFNASSGTFGVGNIGGRGQGSITLAAASNNITASTVAIETSSASSSVSRTSTLGAGTNIINADTINIAATRASGTLRFDPAVPTGGLRIRGTSGADSSRSAVTLGNRSSGGTSGTATGILALNDHPVDLKFSTLVLGTINQVSPVAAVGTLQFNQGTVDATAINMAIDSSTGNSTGNLTVGGGSLIVGSGGISLVNQTSSGPSVGNVSFTSANVVCSNSIVKTTLAGAANISLVDSALNMVSGSIGSLDKPIDSLTLTDNGLGSNKITVTVVAGVTNIAATSINASGTTTINISAFAGLTGTTQVPLVWYGSGDPFANLALGSYPAGYTVGALIDNTANQTIDVVVTPPAPLIWAGAVGPVLNSSWDTTGTLDWRNGGLPAFYTDGSYVQFDNSASNFVVTLNNTVSPAGLNINSSSNYLFNGSGRLHGLVSLVKQGSGTLILDNTGSNDFTAGVNIQDGTLQLGNNDANGNLPATGGIINNGTLAFSRTDNVTIGNLVSGSGGVTQRGSGTNRFATLNTYTGDTLISSGMIIVSAAAAGNTQIGPTTGAGSVIITNGGTLDIENGTAQSISFTNTTDSAGKQFYISGSGVGGNGVIVNNGTVNQQQAFQNITLTGDAVIGGTGRWDMRVPDGRFQPILDLQGHTLVKIGSNQLSMVALIITNAGAIIISNGVFSTETLSSNSATHFIVEPGAALGHFRQNATLFTAPITLHGGSIRDLNGTPGSTNDGPITLTANSFLDLNPGSGDHVRLNGIIAESGGSCGLTKTNGGSYSMTATNTYTGSTLVVQGALILADNGSIGNSKIINVSSGATFDASQRADQTLTLNANQTLGGFGAVNGIVNASAGSTIAPGSAIAVGTLTFTNSVTMAGTNTMKVSHTGSAASDVLNLISPSTLSLGGTLNISLLGGAYAAGDSFQLFNAPGGITGTFAVTNLPALPGGLDWVTTNLANGILSIIATVNPNPTNITAVITGGTLNLSWPADHTGWKLQVQTNSLGSGLNPNNAAWIDVPGSTSVNSVNIPVDVTRGDVFYRLILP